MKGYVFRCVFPRCTQRSPLCQSVPAAHVSARLQGWMTGPQGYYVCPQHWPQVLAAIDELVNAKEREAMS